MNQIGEPPAAAGSAAIESLVTGVAELDAALRFVRVNPAFCEMLGVGLRRLLGQPVTILHPEPRLHEAAERALQRGGGIRMDAVALCAAPGRECALDFLVSAHADGVLLEARPAVPSTPSRLSESLRGFAHEVRNPLAAISGAAQLLQQRANDAGQRELAQLIRDEANRLAGLTERLLGTRNNTVTRAVNVHALLERVAELLRAERTGLAGRSRPPAAGVAESRAQRGRGECLAHRAAQPRRGGLARCARPACAGAQGRGRGRRRRRTRADRNHAVRADGVGPLGRYGAGSRADTRDRTRTRRRIDLPAARNRIVLRVAAAAPGPGPFARLNQGAAAPAA